MHLSSSDNMVQKIFVQDYSKQAAVLCAQTNDQSQIDEQVHKILSLYLQMGNISCRVVSSFERLQIETALSLIEAILVDSTSRTALLSRNF